MMWMWVLPLLVAVGAKPADKSVATPDIQFFTKSAARPDIKHFTKSATKQSSCSGRTTLAAGDTSTLQSPYSISIYDQTCSYLATSPLGTTMSLTCDMNVQYAWGKCLDLFIFWPAFDVDQQNYLTYCGSQVLVLTTTSNTLAIQFFVRRMSFSNFFCTITVSDDQSPPGPTAAPTPAPTAAPTQKPTPGECQCGVKGGSRIVGGEEAEINEFPWLVAFRTGVTGRVFCGGSLIAKNWVLTAAHCAAVIAPGREIVTVGEHYQNTVDGTEAHYSISEVIPHKDYDQNTVDNDVALIRLAQPVTFNNGVSPVCLPYSLAENDFQDDSGTVAGWGVDAFGGVQNDVLHKVEMPIISTETCRGHYSDNAITDNMMCTYDPGQDACQGDSGGPLTVQKGERHYQVGVVSWGEGCADVGNPGVYAKVTEYLDWIQNKTSRAVCQA